MSFKYCDLEGFLVSARKYRPLRWTDVIGQEHIANTLKNALKQGHVAHAFLFCGPRGVGKTTCARILARVLNCENPSSEWEPCNECNTCKAFQENNSFNIIELDAASNNGVDDMRALVEQVRYQPQYGKYKIYIIDEVHMLTSAAFNAFLKTLEEPPPYAKFILATTEKHKIIPTILSRCQVYDFRRIQVKDIIIQLQKICDQEKITADPEALFVIAQKADGAMRDALSIFDRITSFSGKKISYEDVLENLNVLDQDYYFKFYNAFISEDIKQVFLLYDQVLRLGFDSEVLLEGLASHARNLLVCKDPDMMSLFEGSNVSKDKFINQADTINYSFLMQCLDMINEADVNIVRSRNKRLHLEVLLAKLCQSQHRNINISGVAPEKKTLDLNDDGKQDQLVPKKIQENSIEIEKTASDIILPSVENNVLASSLEIKTPIPNIPKFNSISSSIPKLGNLDSIKKKLASEEKKISENLLDFNEDTVKQFWEKTISEQTSNSLISYMRLAKLNITDQSILVSVGSILAKEAIRSELDIIDKLKNSFKDNQIKLIVEIDPELSTREEISKPKQLYSAKEKWDLLIAVNPLLEELKTKLELKIDED